MKINTDNWIKLYIPIIFSIIAILISGISLYFSYEQNIISKKLSYQFIDPDIDCLINYPKIDNPTLVIKNKSPIEIVSLEIGHELYVYNKVANKIEIDSKMYGDLFQGPVYLGNLNPSDYKILDLIKVSQESSYPVRITIYLFDIKYYRESDMNRYNKRELFFIEDGIVYSQEEYLGNSNYHNIMMAINDYKAKNININEASKLNLSFENISFFLPKNNYE